MVEVRKCSVAEVFDDPEIDGLLDEYRQECAIALVGKPAPRREIYQNLEASGMGQAFSVRDDGKLRGFAMVIAAVVPHYDLGCATYESLFVSREAPGGAELMGACESHAKAVGCVSIFCTAVVGSRLARLLFLSEDKYTMTNHVFCRRLT